MTCFPLIYLWRTTFACLARANQLCELEQTNHRISFLTASTVHSIENLSISWLYSLQLRLTALGSGVIVKVQVRSCASMRT